MSNRETAKVRRLKPAGVRERSLELWVVGLNHQTTPVELREKLAVPEVMVGQAARRALDHLPLREAAVLSTCNRVELIAVTASQQEDVVDEVTRFLAENRELAAGSLAEHRYVHRGRHAVRHLFRVAASLDSMILGEPQILGQLKEQFRLAADAGAASRVLRRCFDRAFSVAKRVRTETGVAAKAVSVSSAAVDLAKRIFDDLGDKTAMLIGAGKMGVLAARHLQKSGVPSVIVTNRSFDRAVELARTFGGTPVPFDRFPQYLHLADVVLGSVTTSGYLVGPSHLPEALRARRRRPMFFIDLGVPRNFDPGINELENVYLYNIDDLARVADEHRSERAREAIRAEEIVRDEAEQFWKWFAADDVTPTIVALHEKLDGIRRAELERAVGSLGPLEARERQVLEAMTQAIVKKVLHHPTVTLKQLALHDEAGEAERVADLLKLLFELDLSHEEPADGDDEA